MEAVGYMSLRSKHIEQNLSELNKWCDDPFNESFMFQTPWINLQRFLASPNVNPGGIAADLNSLSMWFAATGGNDER